MAERRPPGFNVDLGFYDSEEVLSIPRKIRAAAVGVWTLCGSYSANKLTDGYVSAEALRDRGCTPAIRAALVATRPEPLWSDAHAGGIQFTRWPKWQRTSAEVKAYREADAERKRKARDAKRNSPTSDDVETSERTDAGPSQTVQSDSGTPKTETETKTESFLVETSSGGVTSVDAHANNPRPQCLRHPNENARTSCPECRRRREWDEAETARVKADEVAQRRKRREAIDACSLCDQNGKREVTPNSLTDCTHPDSMPQQESRHA